MISSPEHWVPNDFLSTCFVLHSTQNRPPISDIKYLHSKSYCLARGIWAMDEYKVVYWRQLNCGESSHLVHDSTSSYSAYEYLQCGEERFKIEMDLRSLMLDCNLNAVEFVIIFEYFHNLENFNARDQNLMMSHLLEKGTYNFLLNFY